jgi:hypothetical protein
MNTDGETKPAILSTAKNPAGLPDQCLDTIFLLDPTLRSG